MILFSILIILTIIVIVISLLLINHLVKPKLWDIPATIELEKSKGYMENYDSIHKEDFTVSSFDDYMLHCTLLKNDSNRYVIVTHGYTYTKYGSIKYANMFLKLGYNVIIYDLRHHGDNERCYISMGKNESKDISALIDYLRSTFGNDIEIGLHGESLGATSSLLSLSENKNISFCIEDCGFSNLSNLLKYQIKKQYHLPTFFIPIASVLNRLIYHFSFYDINLISSLTNSNVPILFIHGNADTYIPVHLGTDMWKKYKGYKELHLFDNAEHAESYASDPEKYETIVSDFLNNIKRL